MDFFSIQINLTVEETNFVLNTLGQLPTSSGAYPLAMKIKAQAEAQLPKPEETKNGEDRAAD